MGPGLRLPLVVAELIVRKEADRPVVIAVIPVGVAAHIDESRLTGLQHAGPPPERHTRLLCRLHGLFPLFLPLSGRETPIRQGHVGDDDDIPAAEGAAHTVVEGFEPPGLRDFNIPVKADGFVVSVEPRLCVEEGLIPGEADAAEEDAPGLRQLRARVAGDLRLDRQARRSRQ